MNQRKQWVNECRPRKLAETVQSGKALQRSKKLFDITGIVLSDVHPRRTGETSCDVIEWCAESGAHFSKKCGIACMQDRVNILNAVLSTDGLGIPIEPAEMHDAFHRIKRKSRPYH